ncbi:hypothetical protein GCM10009780_22290 [Actinomadura alba]
MSTDGPPTPKAPITRLNTTRSFPLPLFSHDSTTLVVAGYDKDLSHLCRAELVRVGGQQLAEEVVEADDAAVGAVGGVDDGELRAGAL